MLDEGSEVTAEQVSEAVVDVGSEAEAEQVSEAEAEQVYQPEITRRQSSRLKNLYPKGLVNSDKVSCYIIVSIQLVSNIFRHMPEWISSIQNALTLGDMREKIPLMYLIIKFITGKSLDKYKFYKLVIVQSKIF